MAAVYGSLDDGSIVPCQHIRLAGKGRKRDTRHHLIAMVTLLTNESPTSSPEVEAALELRQPTK